MPKGRPPASRAVTVSKALSLLLRHAAEKEGLPIDAQGYANVSDVLAWRKLKSLKVTFPEIVDAVANSDKKRFALLYTPSTTQPTPTATEQIPTSTSTDPSPETQTEQESTDTTTTTTALAATTTDPNPSHYLIRATQGHSIKTVEAAHLLEKLSLSDKDKLPRTVVHGTFHSAWPAIFSSGGLRCMGRNQVHFATGPAVEDVLAGNAVAAPGQVISGMRRDAQVLIYVDLEKALSAGCPFWRSENGVVLSEGLTVNKDGGDGKEDGGEKVVPLEFVDVVVERKMGKIWERGQVVQEWPSEWAQKGGKKRGGPTGKHHS
ncbi:hypothetical protein BO79DRAFT_285314 [Aspergillus costaricaensis CBS 115574]|uniref:Uncharacterized protein n=1 Tax=Aspergillus costaricaensis CBS 115574 TaxID=1448317 RepID=A0ACD1INW9_9EURO|nr:hypothetical protein BO79DRAFT_285314 [Aspergillus costaricaensis CBS 115574]RAK92366.1 hypothetical protein BO79DRAFT_285314 [Aspergillus costaricaensis CBS 115574]